MVTDSKNAHARQLFNGIARNYEGPAQVFSFGQYLRWRRFLVSRLELTPGARVLDVCTGTGGVAVAMARAAPCRVVGLDLSDGMLQVAQGRLEREGLAAKVALVQGRAEGLPFDDASFDAVVFTFLLRYVERPPEVVRDLARVLKAGGQMASLEFHAPPWPVRPLWWLHTRVSFRLGMMFLSPGWREVGAFLGPSISRYYARHTLVDHERWWREAGVPDVQMKTLSLGGAVVMWGRKEARRGG